MRYLMTGGPADGYTMAIDNPTGESIISDEHPEGKYVRVGLTETVQILMWVLDGDE
jgi:hypothetical protein